MGLFLREKNDGRKAPGYAVYLLGGLAAVTAVLILHRRATEEDRSAARPNRAARSHVASITQPASAMAKVEVRTARNAADAPRYRQSPPPSGGPPAVAAGASFSADSFNPIAAALSESPAPPAERVPDTAPRRPLDEGGGADSAYPRLPPAFPAAIPHGAPVSAAAPNGGEQLLGYRDPEADAPDPNETRTAAAPTAKKTAEKVPRGSLLSVFLLTEVDTGNPAALIQFGAATDFYFNHRLQLPFGTRFLGKLAGQAPRDRLNLTADTILYPDGEELPMSASVVEADGDATAIHPGVAAQFLPPPAWAELAPYFSELLTGYLGLLQARAQPQLNFGVGGLSVQTGAANGDLRAPAYQASAQAIQDFTQARLKEFEQRHAAGYVIPAGTACWLQLDADLDLSAAPPAL